MRSLIDNDEQLFFVQQDQFLASQDLQSVLVLLKSLHQRVAHQANCDLTSLNVSSLYSTAEEPSLGTRY